MNRKGFAVTAVIYGLSVLGILIISILMGTLSSTRNNVSEEAKRIERELISFNRSSVVYTTGYHYFTVPEGETGWYRIEAYGRSSLSAKGAFTTGIIYLQEGRTLFIEIPDDDTDSIVKVGSGDGPIIMKAAGGYGSYPGGTLQTYCTESQGGNIDLETFQLKNMSTKNLIGSESTTYNSCAGARTSYMAGYPGSGERVDIDGFGYYFVDGLMMASSHEGTGKVIIQLLSKKDDETPLIPRTNTRMNDVKGLRVINSSGISTTNVVVTVEGRNALVAGSSSSSNQLYYFNTVCGASCNVDDISVLFDTSRNSFIGRVELRLVKENGSEVSIYNSNLGNNNRGFTITPTGIKMSAFQPDPIPVSGKDQIPTHGSYYIIPVVTDHKIVSARKDSETDSNPIGIEYMNGDARQKWEIELITAPNVKINGQKEYFLTESSRYKAMAIYKDENLVKNRVNASMTFNTLSRNIPQIWTITSMNDGTYAIKTVAPSYLSSKRSGFLTVNTAKNNDGSASDYYEQVMIGYAQNPTASSDSSTVPTITERFRLYALDFSHTR